MAKEIEFARNQPIKWYLWTVATLTHPGWSEERVDLTKPISLIYIIDDIFDIYGNLEDLTLFTEAINKYVYILIPSYISQLALNTTSYGHFLHCYPLIT